MGLDPYRDTRDALPDLQLDDQILLEEGDRGLGVMTVADERSRWHCNVCKILRDYVMNVPIESEEGESMAVLICHYCLFALVKERRLAVVNAITYERVMNNSVDSAPAATIEEDGAINIDGFVVNFT